MLVNRFYVPQDELSDIGLAEINMTRLGKFVALTGKNGAGKTRVLTKLINYLAERNAIMPNIERIRRSIEECVHAIKTNPHDHGNINQWRDYINVNTKSLMRGNERVFTESSEVINPISFVPKVLNSC